MTTKKITIKDLCPEDKKKIGDLLKKLSNETEEKEKLRQMLEEDKKLYESKIKSIKDSFVQQPTEFKSESFAQSFIAEPTAATITDIKELRHKFDSVFTTLKKAVKANDTIVSKMNSEYMEEETPKKISPTPIKQDNNNILQSSLMEESMRIMNSNEDKSFISTNANEDLLNVFCGSNRKNSPCPSNIGNRFLSKNSNNKYKEMLGRIREKSKNKDFQERNINLNTYINNNTGSSNMSISNEYQMQYNSKRNQNNEIKTRNVNASSYNSFVPQKTNSINLNFSQNNNNNNFNTFLQTEINDNSTGSNNIQINECNSNQSPTQNQQGNKLLSVMNFLSNQKGVDAMSKLNLSNRKDNNGNNILSTSGSVATSKLEEVVNDNVFNFIFSLENKSNENFVNDVTDNKTDNILNQKEFVAQLEDVEKEIDGLNSIKYSNNKPNQLFHPKKPIQNIKKAKEKDKKVFYEDFKSINSKYI